MERVPSSAFFLYLDTDAGVRDMSLTLHHWLSGGSDPQQQRGGAVLMQPLPVVKRTKAWRNTHVKKLCDGCPRCNNASTVRALDADAETGVQPTMWAWPNTHWGCKASAGSLIFHRSKYFTARFLDSWWLTAGRSTCAQPFDQGPMVCLMENPTFTPYFKLLAEDSFEDNPANYVYREWLTGVLMIR